MKDQGYLQSLLDYNAWANGEMYKVVQDMPLDEVHKERKTSLKSIHVSLNHLLVVEKIWLAHMKCEKHSFENLRTIVHEDIEELRQGHAAMDQKLKDYAADLSGDDLEEVVEYELISGKKGQLSRAMVLTHIVTHGNYHRGWIVDMLGQAGVQQPQMDIPVYERVARESGTQLP